MASTGDSSTPITASTSSLTTKVEIVERQRQRTGSASSHSSLDNTVDFYGLKSKPSIERFSRPSSPPTTASTPASPTSPRSHSSNILPSASFFNPKRATSDLSTLTNTTSQRRGNGPLITRVTSAIGDSPSLTQASSTGQASPIPSTNANAYLASGNGRRYSHAAAEASDDEVDSQLGASGGLSAARLARVSRSGSQDRSAAVGGAGAGGWGGSRSSFEQLGGVAAGAAGSIGRSSFDHDDRGASSSSLGHGHTLIDSTSSAGHAPPQASRDQLIYGETTPRLQQGGASPRVAEYPEGNGSGNKEGAIARARASLSGSPRASPRDEQGSWGGSSHGGHAAGGAATRRTGGGVQLMDVETSGEYEREPKSTTSPTAAAARPAPQQPTKQHTAVALLPLVDATGRKVRNYQLHPGSNRFFLQGRALSSRDNPTPFLISLALAILLPVLFFAFSGPFLWSHLGGGGKASIFVFLYMCAIMWTNMCKTAWRDPGIVPRNLDLTPERKWVDDLHGEGNGGWRAEPRYMRIGEGVVASKWCETCETYRPPRTSHCRLCDNCVDHTDHHCTFLNNCIGRRNYTSFIAFLVSSILCAIYALSFSAWHIARRHALAQNGEAWASRWDVAGSFVVAVLSFALLCPIAGLMSYHMRLLWSNRTTIEMLRPKGDRSGAINPANGKAMGNLYSLQSPFANVVSLLCRPMEIPSWIAPHQYATKDAREEQGNKEREEAV